MPVTKNFLKYTAVSDAETQRVSVIVVCGGSSSRMGGIDKMFSEIGGVPVCVRSISAFQQCDEVDDIVIVTKAESVLRMQQLVESYELSKVCDIVEGGSCRQESVYNGIKALTDDTAVVLVHDGARPLVKNDCILRVIEGVKKYSAVTCAVPLKDTVKTVNADNMVIATPDRSSMQAVQTPQGFSFSLYKSAVEQNADNLNEFTDDCSIVEKSGYAVYTVKGDYKNIKITTAEDLKIAEILLEESL